MITSGEPIVRAARLHGVGDIRLHREPAPPLPGPGRSTVAVTSVGICGSDLHWFAEGGIGETVVGAPVVPGHELAGVALDGPYAGRRVAVDPAIPCEHCEVCREGHGNLCPEVAFAGHGDLDGGLQDRLVWPDRLLHVLPDALSDDAGALLEPLGVAIHAVRLAHVPLGGSVLVVGAGPIGLLAIGVLRRAGVGRVLVAEPLAHRRTSAAAAGADLVLDPDGAAQEVREATGGRGCEVVVELAGTDEAITLAVEAARPGARVVLGGIPSTERSSFPAAGARRRGLSLVMVRRMHATYPLAIRMAAEGPDLDAIVSHRYGLDSAAEAFATAQRRAGDKVVINVRRSSDLAM